MDKAIALKPHLSEKAFGLSEQRNTYVFKVPSGTNRLRLAAAIAAQYSVTVESVRLAGLPGKTKKSYRRGGRVVHRGHTSPVRKAYVRLKEGDKLPVFSTATEDNKKTTKEKK